MKQSLTQFLIESYSFEYHSELNSRLWDNNKLKAKVRRQLLKIAHLYFENLDLDPMYHITDIVMTGSLANYNYTRFSDIDVHVIINKSDSDCGECGFELADILKDKNQIWNDLHDITIFNFPVEVYTQLADEPHHSTGVYSLQNDEWVTEPKRKKGIEREVNEYAINVKSQALKQRIDGFKDSKNCAKIKELRKKIKNMRQAGLERGGEFSIENLVFKDLRNSNYLDKLHDYYLDAFDRSLSLK